jgi:hypothetical protein
VSSGSARETRRLEYQQWWCCEGLGLKSFRTVGGCRNLCLLGVAHIHLRGVRPVLSWTDRSFGVRAPGVLSVVIGNAGDESDYRTWGWYVFEGSDYRTFSQSEIVERLRIESSSDDERWTADANGVRPLMDRQ